MEMINHMRRHLLIGALAMSAAACAAVQGRESTGEYVDDATISTKVRAEIIRDPNLKMGQVGVETMQGVVQLTGFVDSQAASAQAAQVARSVKGVKEVKNSIVVRPAGTTK
jgi:hyperosmotically inducible periplasmic protein